MSLFCDIVSPSLGRTNRNRTNSSCGRDTQHEFDKRASKWGAWSWVSFGIYYLLLLFFLFSLFKVGFVGLVDALRLRLLRLLVQTVNYLICRNPYRTFAFSSSSIPSVYPYHPYLPILSVSVSVFPCLHLQASFKITLERSCLESPGRVVSYPHTRHGHTHKKRN